MTPSLECGVIGRLEIEYYIRDVGEASLEVRGGDGAYAAVGARLWSESIALLTRVGSDFPEEYLEALRRAGLDLHALRHVPEPLPFRRFFAYLSPDERTYANPAAHFLRAGHPLPKELLDLSSEEHGGGRHAALSPAAFRPDDLPMPADLPRAVHLCEGEYLTHILVPVRLREQGVRMITLDPSRAYIEPGLGSEMRDLVSGLDAFLPNDEEAALFFRPSKPDIWEMAEAFGAMGCRHVVIKCGARGQCVWDRDVRRRWLVPAYPVRVTDATGAGAAYCGGFLVGLGQTGDAVEAALRGSVSASLAIEGTGALYPLEALPGLAQARLEALRPGVTPG